MTDEETIQALQRRVRELEAREEARQLTEEARMDNANHIDHWGDDDQDSGMSHSQQCYSDRSDYARERYERGEICEEQMQEIRMGA